MTRSESETRKAHYITWQPGDSTSYEFVVLEHPHGGMVLWWTNGRSTVRGKAPLISTWWPRESTYADLKRVLKASMKLVPYDAEALAIGMAEAGYAQRPARSEVKTDAVRCLS